MSRTFLVPLDGSESSLNALQFALTIVNDKDRVVLINVQRHEYEQFKLIGKIPKEEVEAFHLEEGNKILDAAEEKIANKNIQVEKIVRLGLPSIEIAKAAKEFSAHTIIMGSRGMSPVVSNALGSVTYSVLHLAPCPVTIVPLAE